MIPSLAAGEVRRGIVEYLTTTFALADDATRSALSKFLLYGNEGIAEAGIFRGPFLRVRPPFRTVPETWASPLIHIPQPKDWADDGIQPFVHQGKAWERLAGAGRTPEPTILTTGTGSGKTEGFEVPILDHVVWARSQAVPGIKAIILYPMNALVADQAGRFAKRIATDPRLAKVRVGQFAGGSGSQKVMAANAVIDDYDTMLDDPPDILLTNYKMLDRLLTRANRKRLWDANTPDSLAYLVLDEFHTYDGAQGTDVAMLLRRLGARLGIATADRPLGPVVPVATSATLASTPQARTDLLSFAERIFGVPFTPDSVITEDRLSAEEAVGVPSQFTMPQPDMLAKLDDRNPASLAEAAKQFFPDADGLFDADGSIDRYRLGELVQGHRLMRPVLTHAGGAPTKWARIAERIAQTDGEWEAHHATNPDEVAAAVAWFVALVSHARRYRTTVDANGSTTAKLTPDGERIPYELFAVEVQQWVREVSRLLRTIHPDPAFAWRDDGTVEEGEWLPAIYCRQCGRSGWASTTTDHPPNIGCVDAKMGRSVNTTYQASLTHDEHFRALIHAHPDEVGVRWLSAGDGQQWKDDDSHDTRVPVITHTDPAKAKNQTCPSCDTDDAIRFLGSAVTSLASVTVSQLFGSPMVNPDERKLIAFTDSVQDAAHRAGFFTGRAHRFNLRSLLAGQLIDAGQPVRLTELVDDVLAGADSPENRFNILPPDLHQEPAVRSIIDRDPPTSTASGILDVRTRLDIVLDLGLRGRVGRTLETTGSAAIWIDLTDNQTAAVLQGVREEHALNPPAEQQALDLDEDVEPPDLSADSVWRHWLNGLLVRARDDGAIAHSWFDPWWLDNNPWKIWGGRPTGMPAFPNGIPRPRVPATGGPADGAYDRIGTRSWWENWTVRTLGVGGRNAVTLVTLAFDLLADTSAVDRHTTTVGGTTLTYYTLNPASVVIDDVDSTKGHRMAVCDVCSRRDVTAADRVVDMAGRPCLRFQCPGRYELVEVEENYYRRFYREGVTRRIVAKPHTGQLAREDRVALELAFKHSDRPDAPNVLAATPTLEMGIDIGDLSTTMLTSMPRTQASYAQRIGRSGRQTGNSLVTVFTEADPLSLYYLADPPAMLAGDIRPPDCYLDAVEILQRHLFGFFVDRAADDTLSIGPLPPVAHKLMASWGTPGGWLEEIVTEIETNTAQVEAFLTLFTGHLSDDVVATVRDYATNRIRDRVNDAVTRWRDEDGEYRRREQRMKTAIDAIAENPTPTDSEQRRLRTLRGERAAIMRARNERHRNLDAIATLEAFGLLPNYTLNDDTVSFVATLWYVDADGNYQEIPPITTERAAGQALTELAPGSVFYAGPYKLTVDSLDIGSTAAPLHEQLRTCPACAYAQPHTTGQTAGPCPRCGTGAFADDGNVRTVLRMRQVMTVQPEQDCRVTDDADTRTRVTFDVATGVDIDPATVTHSWRHTDTPFAFEYSGAATIRRLNLGRDNRPGPTTTKINGHEHRTGLFEVCIHCGIVAGVRAKDPRSGEEKHRGFCKSRRGDTAEQFQTLMLGYETVTEAIRILLPVADMDRDERVASFKALLMLGLRESFGGDPDHLRAITTSYPTDDPDQRRQLLVVHDTVTGGTGYVARLADPEEMRQVLSKARDVVARCPCQAQDKPACHLCLLRTADRRDVPKVNRTDALEIVTPLLASWSCEPLADGITGVDVSSLQQSDLERRFKKLLHTLDGRVMPDGTRFTVTSTPTANGRATFSIRASQPNGTTSADGTPNYAVASRWTLIEQKALMAGSHQTTADFYATRDDDTTSPPIAIYLDGYKFHAHPDQNTGAHHRLDDDHLRRDALRVAGTLVWSATWDDVTAVADAWKSGQTLPAKSTAWANQAVSAAEQLFDGTPARHWVASNPMVGLFHFLAHSDTNAWHQTVRQLLLASWRHAGQSGGTAQPVGDVEVAVDTWLSDGTVIEYGGNPPKFMATPVATGAGLRMLIAAKNPASPIGVGVKLPNSSQDVVQEEHPARWTQFLHLTNALQFLNHDGDVGTATTSNLAPSGPSAAPATSPAPEPAGPVTLDPKVLDDILDEPTRQLVADASTAGVDLTGIAVGDEFGDGHLIEVAFEAAHVGILGSDIDGPQLNTAIKWATKAGWDLRRVEDWTVEDLTAALAGNTTTQTTMSEHQ